jgi:hypothetical protein
MEDGVSEMVAKVALAIAGGVFGEASAHQYERSCQAAARAAIEAMREPTEEMLDAHLSLCIAADVEDVGNLREAWQTMIRAALKQP